MNKKHTVQHKVSGISKLKDAVFKIVSTKTFKKIVMLTPFVMLGITALTTLLRLVTGYATLYEYLSQIIGYSILTNIVFLLYGVRHNYCDYSLISILCLLLLNVSNVIAMALGLIGNDFYIAFDAILIVGLFILSAYKFTKKCA